MENVPDTGASLDPAKPKELNGSGGGAGDGRSVIFTPAIPCSVRTRIDNDLQIGRETVGENVTGKKQGIGQWSSDLLVF
jgi:hypothetical protein